MSKIIELKHAKVDVAKPEAAKILQAGNPEIPRLSIDIINNRWRAYSKCGTMTELDPETAKLVEAALDTIVHMDILCDQRDVYYGLRGKHADWKISGHPLDTIQAYDAFVGGIMEKLQLWTGYTMQSLGVRAGPRGFITGDDRSYFKLPSGLEIKVSASPALKFNLVDEDVEFHTQARKLIHYEKSAGMDALLVNDIPTMLEGVFMTSQGYSVEAATKLHADMEKRGLKLYVLGDADPHGMTIQFMYGRGSKSNAYMPDAFYPKNATLLGLFPRIATELGLPPEHVTPEHEKILPNLRKLAEETRPDMIGDVEIFEQLKNKWEWQALSAQDQYAPAIYMIEALRARGDEIKYVPKAEDVAATIEDTIKQDVDTFVDDQIDAFARSWLIENLKPQLVEQLREDLADDIQKFKDDAESELDALRLISRDNPEDLREAIKLKLVKNPKQYWTDGCRKVINDMLQEKFEITAEGITGDVSTEGSGKADVSVTINKPEVPEQPLTKDDIVGSIEKRVTGKQTLIQRIRSAVEKVIGVPNQRW